MHRSLRISEEELVTYWAGEVDPAEVDRLDEHLMGCATCTEASARISAVTEALRALIPPTMDHARLALLRAHGQAPSGSRAIRSRISTKRAGSSPRWDRRVGGDQLAVGGARVRRSASSCGPTEDGATITEPGQRAHNTSPQNDPVFPGSRGGGAGTEALRSTGWLLDRGRRRGTSIYPFVTSMRRQAISAAMCRR